MDGIGKSKKHLYQKVNQISSSPSTRKADALKPWHHLHDPKDTEISNQSKQGPVFFTGGTARFFNGTWVFKKGTTCSTKEVFRSVYVWIAWNHCWLRVGFASISPFQTCMSCWCWFIWGWSSIQEARINGSFVPCVLYVGGQGMPKPWWIDFSGIPWVVNSISTKRWWNWQCSKKMLKITLITLFPEGYSRCVCWGVPLIGSFSATMIFEMFQVFRVSWVGV